jgi:hypothetical protein
MKTIWNNINYRSNQLQIKRTETYKESARQASITRWEDEEYRQKLEVGIRADEYIEKCKAKFNGQFSYNPNSFIDWKHDILITCLKCDTKFNRKPLQHLNIGYCPTCNTSLGQREVADYVTSLGENVRLNDRSQIDGELDIFIPEKMVAFEYHGLFWHSHNKPETRKEKYRHQIKAIKCAHAQIKLYQFFDYEWQRNSAILKSMIKNSLGKSMKIDARKLSLETIKTDEAAVFFNQNHLQGHRPARVTLSLKTDNEIMMAASCSKHKDGYELIRIATREGYQVRGGAGRLIKNLMISRDMESLYTFADMRYSTGHVYKTLGFHKISMTQPGYFYYIKNGTQPIILSRQQCQKHKLDKLLGKDFDPKLSESQNMFNNGYRRAWTAGNIKLVLNAS